MRAPYDAVMTEVEDALTNALRRRIIDGEFAPGTRLSEISLAEQLGVSRNTLREAFRVLAEQGLIEHVPASRSLGRLPHGRGRRRHLSGAALRRARRVAPRAPRCIPR